MTTLEFDRLVRQYQGLVYTVCHQLVPDVGEAQDLTQETFLAAWRSIDRCPPGFEKQWLARHRLQQGERLLTQRLGPAGEHPWRRGAGAGGRSAGVGPRAAGAGDVGRGRTHPPHSGSAGALQNALPPDAAGAAYPLRKPARLCGRPQKTVEAQVYRAKKMLAAQLRASGAEAPQKPERRNQNG